MSNANSNKTIFNTVEARIGQRFHSNPILVGAFAFVLLFGSFLASAFLFGAVLFDISSIFQPGVESFLIWPPAWTAFTISILITVILVNENLGIRRYDKTTQKLTQIIEPYAGFSDQLKCMSSQQLRYLNIVALETRFSNGNDPKVATKLMVLLAMERRVVNLSEPTLEFPAGVKALVYLLLPVMTLIAASIARSMVDIAAHRIME